MSYEIEIHSIVKKIVDKQAFDWVEAKMLLDMELAEEEQLLAIRTYARLKTVQDIEGFLEWDGYDVANFCERFGIDEPTVQRWQSEGMTAFERDMVIYLLCQAEIMDDRIQFCSTCGKMFSAFMPEGGTCPECQAEQIAKTVCSCLERRPAKP